MKKRTLGKSSLHISELSLGCMSLPTSIEEARPIVAAALDVGINYFDTADLYDRGINEEIIGSLLKPQRHDIILATKVGNRLDEDKKGWSWDPSPKYIQSAIRESLRRLQTDYIDLYQLHGGTIDDPWDEIIDTFEQLKKEGLIREYGISSIRPNVIKRFLPDSHAISVMMQYSLLDRRAEEWFDFIEHQGASVVTRGSIAKGLLTANWLEHLAKSNSYLTYSPDELQQTLTTLNVSYEDIHALALAFNLNHPAIASIVVGASSVTQILENITAYESSKKITDLKLAMDATKTEIYTEHRE